MNWIQAKQKSNEYAGCVCVCVCVAEMCRQEKLVTALNGISKQFNDCLLMTFSMNKIVKLRSEMQVLRQEICCVMLKHNNALKTMKNPQSFYISKWKSFEKRILKLDGDGKKREDKMEFIGTWNFSISRKWNVEIVCMCVFDIMCKCEEVFCAKSSEWTSFRSVIFGFHKQKDNRHWHDSVWAKLVL